MDFSGINVGSAYMTKKQKEAVLDAIVRTASTFNQEGVDVTAASPVAGAGLAQLVEQELGRPGGMNRVAFAMHPVLKNRLDYLAIGRQNLLVLDEITTGDVTVYDLDIPEYGAVATAGRGEPVQFFSNVTRFAVPTGDLSAVQQVQYGDVVTRRYPLFDRAKERVAIAMAIAEDDAILGAGGVVDVAAGKSVNGTISSSNVNRYLFADLYGKIVQNQLAIKSYLMHPILYAQILKWSANELDQVSLNHVIETGTVGSLLGQQLLLSTRVDKTKIYGLTTPDKLGRLPERKAVEVKVFDDVLKLRFAIMGWEHVGFTVWNTSGVAQAVIS